MSIQRWSDNILLVTPPKPPGFNEDIGDAMTILQAENHHSVIIDMHEIDTLNSSNLSQLLRIRKHLLNHDGQLLLCSVTTGAWGTLLVTGLDAIFRFSDDVTTALTQIHVDEGGPPGDG